MTTMRGALAGCLLVWATGGPVAGADLAEGQMRATSEDTVGDGVAEIILENGYVRVEILTGQAPARPTPSRWGRLWPRRSSAAATARGTRFVAPGWIANLEFKPTGRRWFATTGQGGESWRGIPEEFEQAVRIRETSPGVWRCLKLGVGLCEGQGWCLRDSLRLLDAGQWEVSIAETPGGGRSVTFQQTLNVEDGYGYRYRKRLSLMPGDTRLLIERTLTNTGSRTLATTWYSHAFWGQGRAGAYDEHCWTTVPLLRGPPGVWPDLDVEPCVIAALPGTGYWGPLDRDLIGDAWYACGNRERAEVFLTVLPEIPAFYRVWTYAPTYSLEPFRLLQVEPGQEERWLETLACGAGLDRLETHDGTAAYSHSVDPGSADRPATLTLQVLPFCEVRNGTLQVTARLAGGAERTSEHAVPDAGPARPIAVPLSELAGDLPAVVGVRLRTDTAPALPPGACERTGWLTIRPVAVEPLPLPQPAQGARALVVGAFERDAQGALVPSHAAEYLVEYLHTAGFLTSLGHDSGGLPVVGQPQPVLVVCVGLRALPVAVLRQLEAFVRGGGGLIVCGLIDPPALEFTDLLPLQAVGATVRLGPGPRDGTREFVEAWRGRYQLQRVSAVGHPVLQGLALFPGAHQDIGVLQVLTPTAAAEVLLRYHTPSGLLPEVSTPALVLSSYGKGRVAVLASPVDWGIPSHWLLWSRVGEQHQALFMRLARWAVAGAPGGTSGVRQ